jgi:tetratricopeptide (TPR) repeat protein
MRSCPSKTRRSRGALAAVALALLIGLPASALAAVPKPRPAEPPPSAESTSSDPCLRDPECKRLVNAGRADSEAGQFATALASYQSAYARVPAPWLLVNIGRMLQKLGRHEEALNSYAQFLTTDLGRADAVLRGRVQGYLAEAENTVSEQKKQTASEQARLGEQERRLAGLKAQLDTQQNLLVLEKGKLAATSRPVYKRWWFWVLIGGATAAVATSVAVGASLAASSREPDYVAGLPQLRPFP